MFIRVTLIADPPLTQKKTYAESRANITFPRILPPPQYTHMDICM